MIYEQADRTGDKITYSWILTGPESMGPLLGNAWKWIKGSGRCTGSFVTNDSAAAAKVAREHKFKVKSNGSHKAANAPFKIAAN